MAKPVDLECMEWYADIPEQPTMALTKINSGIVDAGSINAPSDLTFTTTASDNSLVFNGNDLVFSSGDGWHDPYVKASDIEKLDDRLERIENALMIPPELKADPERIKIHKEMMEIYERYQHLDEALKTWERLAGKRDD